METVIYNRLVDFVSELTGGTQGGFDLGFDSGFDEEEAGRIYPNRPEENAQVPYVIYSVSREPLPGTLKGPTLTAYNVDIESVAFDHDECQAIALAVQNALHYWRDLDFGVQLGKLNVANEVPIDGGYQIHQEFTVIGE